jgi:hypothetical protein
MTDTPAEVEAARALVAAYDALNSPDHAADAQRLRELSISVAGRVEAYAAAQAALHAANAGACASGVAPADNTQAERMFIGPYSGWEKGVQGDLEDHGVVDLSDLTASYTDDDEHQTARANGADSNA